MRAASVNHTVRGEASREELSVVELLCNNLVNVLHRTLRRMHPDKGTPVASARREDGQPLDRCLPDEDALV